MANCTPHTQDVIDGDGNLQSFPVPPASLVPVQIAAGTVYPLTLQAATAGEFTRLWRALLVASGTVIVEFYDGATLLLAAPLTAGQILQFDASLFPWAQGSVNTDFKMTVIATGGATLTGGVWFDLSAT